MGGGTFVNDSAICLKPALGVVSALGVSVLGVFSDFLMNDVLSSSWDDWGYINKSKGITERTGVFAFFIGKTATLPGVFTTTIN